MAKPAEMRRHTRARRPLNPSLKRLQARRAVKNKQLGSLRRGSECIKISSRYIGTESDAKALMRKLAKGTNLQRLRLRAAAASATLSFNFMTIPSRRMQLCLLKTSSAAEILDRYRPKCGPEQDRNLNSLSGRENSLFFAEPGVLVQRSMRPRLIIVGGILRQNPAQVRFIEHDDVVDTFPADRADWSLGVGVLPRRAC
jgi:hypothetical protein